MASGSLRGTLRRRWYLVLVGALLTAGLMFAASAVTPIKYEASGTVLILPPAGDGSGNPYLSLSGYGGFADVLARSMMDTSATQAMRAKGVTDQFTIERDITTSAPIVRVSVGGTDGTRALEEVGIIIDSIPDALVSIQQSESVPEQAMFRSKIIAAADEATAVRKPQVRAIIAAGAAGVLITIWGTVWLDSMLSRSSRRGGSRRASRRSASEPSGAAGDGDADRARPSEESDTAADDYLDGVTSPDDISSLALIDHRVDLVRTSPRSGSRHGAGRRG